MGALVREHGLRPDVVLSSDAVRARLTAKAVAEAARDAEEVLLDPRLYMACPARHPLAAANSAGERRDRDDRRTQSRLEQLVEQLTGEREDLPTAALAQIELPIDLWRDLSLTTRGTLVGLWRPGDLT